MQICKTPGPWARGVAILRTMGSIEQLVSTFNIPLEISIPIARLFREWVLKSGSEWAVARMKDYQVNLIRHLAGEGPDYGLWTSLSKDGIPKGPIGGLFRWVASNPSRKRRANAITLLRMYTKLVSSEVTPKQERKFLAGVQCPPSNVPCDLGNGVVEGLKRLGVPRSIVGLPRPLYTMIPNPAKRHPLPNGKTYPEDQYLTLSTGYLFDTALGRRLHDEFNPILRRVCEGTTYEKESATPSGLWESFPDSVGRIGLIQEPGFKLRAVANPGRVYQQAMRPLGGLLFRTLSHLPWDCTFDQARPMCVLQEHLSAGFPLHCVDLTGATDYFPLELQIPALNYLTLGKGGHVELFCELSRAPWQYGEGTVSWLRGQPLGLFPSFAAFSLTHGLLLYHLNGYRFDNRFFILGDDVVILDSALAMRYKEVLADLGCPISLNKTLDSTRMGEFAGRLIFPDAVLPQLKWKDASDDSFVEWARHFGKPALGLLRPRQRKVIEMICDIPEFLGGLGWNPQGLPLEERVAKYHRLFDREEVVGSYLMSYNGLVSRAVYGPRLCLPHVSLSTRLTPEGEAYVRTFDQKVSALTAQELGDVYRFIGDVSPLGRNLKMVAPDLDLPLEGGEGPFRRTMLEILERLLK